MDIVTDIEKLRRPTAFATEEDGTVALAELLLREMKEHNAQGLAANQLGYNLRVFVMEYEGRTPVCVVNPRRTKEKGWQESRETCLSLPGVIVCVKRPAIVRVKGVNQYFNPVNYLLRGVNARRACHEIDHLNGKLILDYKGNSMEPA